MSMKKKLLVMTLAAIFATPSLYAAYDANADVNTGTTDDDAADVQTVNVTVPEIALLDITNSVTDGIVNIIVPEEAITDAGTGFGAYPATETVTYAISSNVDSASGATTTARTLGVAMTTGSLPAGAKLTIVSTTGTEIGDEDILHAMSPTALQSSGTAVTTTTLASNIKNVTLNGGDLAYTLEPIDTNGMMSFTGTDGTTADAITLTYTLSDDV